VLNAPAKDSRGVPRVISVEEIPQGTSRIGNPHQTMGREAGEAFTKPSKATGGRDKGKPSPLSRKKARQPDVEMTEEMATDSDESNCSKMSVGSGVSIESTASGVKRKRGRQPTTGEYVGLKAAKQEALEAEIKLMEARAEREMAEMAYEARRTRSKTNELLFTEGLRGLKQKEIEDPSAAEPETEITESEIEGITALRKRIKGDLEMVTTVATKSSNLKGGYIKALKEAAKSIDDAVEVLLTRSTREENIQLERENQRLRSNNTALREEIKSLNSEMSVLRENFKELKQSWTRDYSMGQDKDLSLDSASGLQAESMEIETVGGKPAPTQQHRVEKLKPIGVAEEPTENLIRTVMTQVGAMLNARFEALEARLLPEKSLRPKLTGRSQAQSRTTDEPTTYATVLTRRGQINDQGNKTDTKKKEATGKTSSLPEKTIIIKKNISRGKPETMDKDRKAEWTIVAKRSRKRAAKETNTSVKKVPEKSKEPLNKKQGKIKLPKCAAVVVTPNTSRGVTRTDVMKEAKSKIKIEEIGIEYLRPRISVTGAVILEIPGEAGAAKADKLADRLREIFNEDKAKIARPVKRADLRLAGLDESVTREELIAAMSHNGGCPAEECRLGEIRRGPTGMGTVWANCPATAAKKLTEKARIKVGWTMIRIVALTPRPLQCYRCLEPGHTRAKCIAPVDRGDRCYRCGRPGHTARGCLEAPKCPLCSDIGRPSDHRLGSSACAPPRKGRIIREGIQTGTHERTRPDANRQNNESVRMDVSHLEDKEPSPKPRRIPRPTTENESRTIDGLQKESGDERGGGLPYCTPLPPTPPPKLNEEGTPEEAMEVV